MTQPQPAATLTWGVKQSFRSYVSATGGVTETGAGCEVTPDGAFVFAAAPDSTLTLDGDGKPQGQGRFLGEVKFEAHGGMLKVFLADPILEIGPTGAVLTVADTAKRDYRVELAHLDLPAATRGEAGELVIPTALSMKGIQLLGDHYAPNTPLDPAILTLAGG